jgi:hypothetical protein
MGGLFQLRDAGVFRRGIARFPFEATMPRGYTAAVMSKKGVIGIGLLKHLCDESRSTRKVCGFVVRAPSFGGSTGGRKPGRFSQEVPGSPTRRAAAPDWTRERRFQ